MSRLMAIFGSSESIALDKIPRYPLNDFLQGVVEECDTGWLILSYFAAREGEELLLYAVMGSVARKEFGVMKTAIEGSLPSLTPYLRHLHLFEREIAENFGVRLEDHPWFKPLRFVRPVNGAADAWRRDPQAAILPCVTDFYQVAGEEVHEVAVGPVHAGIIEPGHFRFQCLGEEVFHLEIALGYQHRGVETLLCGRPSAATYHRIEAVAGDTTVGHGYAHAMVLEALAKSPAAPRGDTIRCIALELERLANHTGDLGALAGDVGYLPTMSYCGRIRGDFLNMSALICGSRFSRGLVRAGGTAFDLSAGQIAQLQMRLESAACDLTNAVELLFNSSSTMTRFENTGEVSLDTALELGLVGVAARASGVVRDVRTDFPFGVYREKIWKTQTDHHGDVYSRALVRWLEAKESIAFIVAALQSLPRGNSMAYVDSLPPESLAVGLTEGWRGEICHTAITDKQGGFSTYKIVDPSFHNWTGLAMALRGEQISDFPLCNKSFNLSYCGFDL